MSFNEFESSIYPFELISLPYNKSDFSDTFLSAESFEYHYNKHHSTYVNNLNSLLQKEGKDMQSKNIRDIILFSKDNLSMRKIYNNAAQVWNHSFFWHCLSPLNLEKGNYKVFHAIVKQYDSWENFMQKFVEVSLSHFGSGWSWLIFNKAKKVFDVISTKDAGTGFENHDLVPIFTCDLWEHAYYIDFKNNRKQYIETLLSGYMNWQFIEHNYGLV